jgi:hypothetical protein
MGQAQSTPQPVTSPITTPNISIQTEKPIYGFDQYLNITPPPQREFNYLPYITSIIIVFLSSCFAIIGLFLGLKYYKIDKLTN